MRGKESNVFRRLPHVLCIDEGNSDRSQMAEGYLRTLAGEFVDAQSAGLRNQPLSRMTVQVMQEDGVDIRRQSEKLLSRELLLWADIIIVISGPTETLHAPIPNSAVEKRWLISPPIDSDDDAATPFRRTRDEVKRRVQQFVNALKLSRLSTS
jgi:arsenate reductase (thioredoxin)